MENNEVKIILQRSLYEKAESLTTDTIDQKIHNVDTPTIAVVKKY